MLAIDQIGSGVIADHRLRLHCVPAVSPTGRPRCPDAGCGCRAAVRRLSRKVIDVSAPAYIVPSMLGTARPVGYFLREVAPARRMRHDGPVP